jgi:hypothetical protein
MEENCTSYICECCGEEFVEGWSNSEAEEERAKLFGGPRDPTDAKVCDGCFKKIMRTINS